MPLPLGGATPAVYTNDMAQTESSTGHVILGGFGKLGREIAEQLRERGYEVLVIESRADIVLQTEAEALGCRYQVGDASEALALTAAGITTARCAIFATDTERVNLQGAIKARRLHPRLPVICCLFDEALVRHTEKIFTIHPLNPAELASPAVVSAATGISLLAEYEMDGHVLMLYHGDAMTSDYAGIRIDGERLAQAESPEEIELQACIFGIHDHAVRRKVHHQHLDHHRLHWSRVIHPLRMWRQLRERWRQSSAITRRLIYATLIVVIFSTIVFTLASPLNLLDSLYFVVTTITTVGYGDINLAQSPPALKIFGILLILAGATLLANLYTLIADFVLTARMEHMMGRRRVRLHGHYVVAGLGNLGSRVAFDLHRLGTDVVAVECNAEAENIATARTHFPTIIGNAARKEVLQMAGIEQASVLITATGDPMLNLSIALHARELHPHLKIVVLTHDDSLAETFTGLGFHFVLNTAAVAAPAFIDAALYPGVEATFRADGQDILIARYKVTADSLLAGRSVHDIGHELGIVPLLDSDVHFLAPESILAEGQEVLLLLTREKARSFLVGSPVPTSNWMPILVSRSRVS